jgi:acetoin utilization deacetylase AcuC-like enzyme
MPTLLIQDPLFLKHVMPQGHPERPARLQAIEQVLAQPSFEALLRESAVAAPAAAAELAHPAAHVRRVCSTVVEDDFHFFDNDTPMSPDSLNVALHAVGSALRAVDAVMSGEVNNAFVAARPPGHHAEKDQAMGFCFFNNIAIAARHAQRAHGAERVAIIDWDVHHGNGTQDIFWSDKSVLFCSTHEMPLYPGTGAGRETGDHNTIVNVPLSAGDDGKVFKDIFRSTILPRVKAHAPDLILISAGFDAHVRDPLANIQLVEADYAWATEELMEIASSRCKGRVVSLLEGGYDLQGLAFSVGAHVKTLMGA